MPKATKEVKNEDLKDTKTTKSTASTKKKTTSAKTNSNKIKNSGTDSKLKKVNTAKNKTSKTSKTSTTGKIEKVAKASAKKKTKATSTKKSNSSTSRKVKKLEPNILAEYYDLPYRYNETIIKILYQTPTILFVYWDISDDDRANLINKYGEHFFHNTKPILKVYNTTMNYSFEVEINDFANSWYINVNDANCEYKVELTRKVITYEENIKQDYISITYSNKIEFPNDHILLEKLPNNIRFKNVKNNKVSTKDISTIHLVEINKIYNVQNFYKRFYKDEILNNLNNNRIIIPSSSSWN